MREVYPLKNLTPLPCTPPFVRGIVNVRGRIMPVLDIKKFFDLPEGLTDLHRVILVGGDDLELGLLADVIVGMRPVPMDSLQAALPTLTDIRGEYLKGVTAERLVVLDLDRILADPKIFVHEEVETERQSSTEKRTMKWNVGTKIGTGFALALAILVAIGVVSYRNTVKLTDTADWVTHTIRCWKNSKPCYPP